MYASSETPRPPVKIPGPDEKALRECHERVDEIMKEINKQREIRKAAKLKELGFRSWEGYESYLTEQLRQGAALHEKWLEEECARTGKTVDELYEDDPQRDVDKPLMAPFIPCDCDGHTFPHFCPRRLVDYRSQEPVGEFAEFIKEEQRYQLEGLRIDQGDVSRRLEPEALEKHWSWNSQKSSLELPPWFAQDEVLQDIVNMDRRSSTAHSDLSDNDDTKMTDDATTATSENEVRSGVHSPARNNKSQVPFIERKNLQNLRIKHTRRNTWDTTTRRLLTDNETEKVARPQPTQALRPRERRPEKNSGIKKSSSIPARQTRSRNVTRFYKLDRGGRMISYQSCSSPRQGQRFGT